MTPADVRDLFLGATPFAIVDPLEEGLFAETPHLLRAVNIPYGTLEGEIERRIPDRRTLIVIPHDHDGLGEDAARRIRQLGYGHIEVVRASPQDWADAGVPLYTGFNVYSKAFGEYLEHSAQTPTLDVRDFDAAAAQRKLDLYDVRPMGEYTYETVPGARNLVGVDVGPYCLQAHDPQDELIVHCGGRTRSIIAAETLRLLGFQNAKSLKNGTMGWSLAGRALKFGEKAEPIVPDAGAAGALIPKIIDRLGIDFAGLEALARVLAGAVLPYCFDLSPSVRVLPGFIPAAGGQLIQATDSYVAVPNAPVLLHDTDDVRALVTAYWLQRMGYDAWVVKHENADFVVTRLAQAMREAKGRTAQAGLISGMLPRSETPERGVASVLFVDASPLRLHEFKRVEGSLHFMRRRFDWKAFTEASQGRKVVLYGSSADLCKHALRDFAERGYDIGYTDATVDALHEMGWAVTQGRISSGDFYPDEFVRPIERPSHREEAMAQYLAWEVELPEKMANDQTIAFTKI